jgi:hypothetical protein
VVWEDGEVHVEAIGLHGTPRVTYAKTQA